MRRRRFTEAVLAGVSAGVIGLDIDGHITIVNRAAARLLNAAPEELESRHYSEAVPELAGLIRRALQEPIGRSSGEATVKRAGSVRNLSVQVDSEKDDARLHRHLRRHHRSRLRAAHRRLGRRGATHRA